MTARQLEQIAALRERNYPYSFLGRELTLSPNTVKSISGSGCSSASASPICRRKGFRASGSRKTKREKATAVLCRNCRKPLPADMRSDAVFCCESCRTEWRRNNRKIIRK